MKKALQRTLQTFCLFLTALGAIATVVAGCFIAVMFIAWSQEGRLQFEDKRLLIKGTAGLLGSLIFVGATWWAGRRLAAKDDGSFRLVLSRSGRSEEKAQPVFQTAFFVVAAILLWPITSGNPTTRISLVAAWLLIGFLGLLFRVLLHELGHLTVAALWGFELRKLQVGVGYLLGFFRFPNGLHCELRAWPYGGFLFAIPRSRKNFRARQSLFIAGGPLMDVLILWMAYNEITRDFGGLARRSCPARPA